ncbi:hypothetical protein [Paenibacillus apiarius]|uniref:hypothetical protein n=1 Tax=Paenibacillus apiarius TaxID=46240 RepID=UPI003B3A2D4C
MKAKIKHSITNESNMYLVVGNCSEIIDSFKTVEEANSALRMINIEESKWANAQVVAPRETAACELIAPVRAKEEGSIEDDPMFGKFFK